jgi:hypothetical protein
MTKNTRLLILIACFVLFFTITPWLILYSLGYRIDFKNQCIVATGGIYVRAEQTGTEVIIDSKIDQKSSFFSNSVFVQNLTPQIHNVLVKKEGYFEYQKNIPVREKEVTKIENITLFKNNITFQEADQSLIKTMFTQKDSNQQFFLKSGNLYYSNLPQNYGIVAQSNLIIKKVLSYTTNNNIIWLGQDGNLSQSDIAGKNTEILTTKPLIVNKASSYKIFVNNFGTFVLENKNLLLLNKNTQILEQFASNINDLKLSLDGQNIFYATNNEIYLNHSNYEYGQNQFQLDEKILLNKFYENISDIFWLNNNYLIMRANPSTPFDSAQGKDSGQAIKISEIDNRGNINLIDLPLSTNITLSSSSQIYFNPQDKKLYILSEGILMSSDRLLP